MAARTPTDSPAVLCIFQLPAMSGCGASAASRLRSMRASTPGSARPSRNSSDAPPPVETCVRCASRPERLHRRDRIAAADDRERRRSPRRPRRPPRCRRRTASISKTPIGPFQKIVPAPADWRANAAAVCGPMSRRHLAGRRRRRRRRPSARRPPSSLMRHDEVHGQHRAQAPSRRLRRAPRRPARPVVLATASCRSRSPWRRGRCWPSRRRRGRVGDRRAASR